MCRSILNFDNDVVLDEPNLSEAVEEAEEKAEESIAPGPDYTQMLYEYIVSRDVMENQRQEEAYAAYTKKLNEIESHLNWTVAFLVLFAVLVLFRSVRRWSRILTGGGNKDVY